MHDLLLFERNDPLFLLNLLLDHHACLLNFPLSGFLDLELGNLLVSLNLLLLHLVFVRQVLHVLVQAVLVLLGLDLSLVRFLLLRHCNRLHDLLLFLLLVVTRPLIIFRHLLLFKFDLLHVVNLSSHSFIVALFQSHDFLGPLFGFLYLFPGPHLLLLEQCNAVGKQLRVLFYSKDGLKGYLTQL